MSVSFVRRFLVCGLCVVAIPLGKYSRCVAGVGQWKTYTAQRNVRALAYDNRTGVIWAATSGGLFSYGLSDSTYTVFTASEGLRTIDITAITVDSGGTIWSGASNGFVHAYNPKTKLWQYVSDIFFLSVPQKQINALQARGDTLFIISDIGVSIFSISHMQFGDTYTRFGTAPTQLVGNATSMEIFAGKLWVSTRSGIASTPTSNPNPSAPESWQVYTVAQGLPSNLTSGLAVLGDTLYAGTNLGVAYLAGMSWNSVHGTEGLNILSVAYHAGCPLCVRRDPPRISFVTAGRYGIILNSNDINLSSIPGFTLTTVVDQTFPVVGTQGSGILIPQVRDTSWQSAIPPGPPTNRFFGIATDLRGVLWSGTGVTSTDGIVRFDGQTWRSYTPRTDTLLRSGSAFQVNIGSNNTKWVSFFGTGVAVIGTNDAVEKVFDHRNGLSYTVTNDTNFVVVHGVATDQQGNVWINVRTAIDKKVLAIYAPSANSLRYVQYSGPTVKTPIMVNIAMDSYGTAWFPTTTDAGAGNIAPGLVLYNPATGWDIVTKTDGLTDNEVSAVAIDNDQNVWAGTVSGGINIIYDPTSPHDHILIYHPLSDQRVYDILVDPINNKWVATDNGVFVLSSDGTSILDRYTTESTDGKLPDNKITSITMDRKSGTIYFGTEKGLASLTTTAAAPVQSFSSLALSPNPYYLPSTAQLTVDGLVSNSSLKILSIDGKLVRDLSTPGGRVGFWDGMDSNGHLVGTGIYLVIAYSTDGNQVAAGKLAVIRK